MTALPGFAKRFGSIIVLLIAWEVLGQLELVDPLLLPADGLDIRKGSSHQEAGRATLAALDKREFERGMARDHSVVLVDDPHRHAESIGSRQIDFVLFRQREAPLRILV